MKFSSTSTYIATEELQMAVNAAVDLERPLLIKGEPGTGKTMLAEEIASSLGMQLIPWHIKSTTKAQQGLYEYDAVSRLRDSQLGDDRVHDINNYIDSTFERFISWTVHRRVAHLCLAIIATLKKYGDNCRHLCIRLLSIKKRSAE